MMSQYHGLIRGSILGSHLNLVHRLAAASKKKYPNSIAHSILSPELKGNRMIWWCWGCWRHIASPFYHTELKSCTSETEMNAVGFVLHTTLFIGKCSVTPIAKVLRIFNTASVAQLGKNSLKKGSWAFTIICFVHHWTLLFWAFGFFSTVTDITVFATYCINYSLIYLFICCTTPHVWINIIYKPHLNSLIMY